MTDTITLKRSVVEQALEALNASMPHNNDMDHDWPSHIAARRALRAALEQPQVEQEPIAWANINKQGDITHTSNKKTTWAKTPLYTHPQNLNCKSTQHRLATLWGYEKPQPPRQPLTDEEIDKLPWGPHEGNPMTFAEGLRDFARAIERAHGIGGEK